MNPSNQPELSHAGDKRPHDRVSRRKPRATGVLLMDQGVRSERTGALPARNCRVRQDLPG
jgi:hypothetical protein